MGNGKPGDHPVTDMLLEYDNIMGTQGDELLKALVKKRGLSFVKTWFEQNLYQKVYDVNEKLNELQCLLDEDY